ncbi:unnamed protein product [Vitrella brassicaformis CCMP3155]|uniref:Uncharacterized protein n=1 Tax=Vitrella brassicaformis (strain CCMP3155) TaxID=1169540 RepID=A0A0G4ED84_VITBC|nr:unnamed protein product [Vitrella brassicaformis CCMP3155]|mmetsp:Transcript_31768/g.78752  ORF Transcript_31768/g.78752 Transcript_31768/m.78752 type:complete len:1618 (-) Transcript_31768:194-5047(-)|eukprot:CEL93310.1 unnamed protein product [Vitrella brassicaformis CCMP3155]
MRQGLDPKRSVLYTLSDGKVVSISLDETTDLSAVRVKVTTTVGSGASASQLFLHWGVCLRSTTEWAVPIPEIIPPGSEVINGAVRTPFSPVGAVAGGGGTSSRQTVVIDFGPAAEVPLGFQFVLYQKDDGTGADKWVRPGINNFFFPIKTVISDLQMAEVRQALVDRLPAVNMKFELPQHQCSLDVFIWTQDDRAEVEVLTNVGFDVLLHWGCVETDDKTDRWTMPEPRLRPVDTVENPPTPRGGGSVQTLLHRGVHGGGTYAVQSVRLVMPYSISPRQMAFVLKSRHSNEWVKYLGGDFLVPIPYSKVWQQRLRDVREAQDKSKQQPMVHQFRQRKGNLVQLRLERKAKEQDMIFFRTYQVRDSMSVGDGPSSGVIGEVDVVAYDDSHHSVKVQVIASVEGANQPIPLTFHWGVCLTRRSREWALPKREYWPEDTTAVSSMACETRLRTDPSSGLQTVNLELPKGVSEEKREAEVFGLWFVFREANGPRWFKDGQRCDFFIKTRRDTPQEVWRGRLQPLVDKILRAELQRPAWSIVQRYSLCQELLDDDSLSKADIDVWAWIYVWFKFASLRVLDCQRGGSTTHPKTLAAAGNQLSLTLCHFWRSSVKNRPIIRMILAMLGRGSVSSGQRIEHDLYQIIHRPGRPQSHSQFLDQWLKKVTHNPTPDDLLICKGLLAYLKSGQVSDYWGTLEDGGLTRASIGTPEHPMEVDPCFSCFDAPAPGGRSSTGSTPPGTPGGSHHSPGGVASHSKRRERDELVKDFEEYLKVLKAVHDPTDLRTAVAYARNSLTMELEEALDEILNYPGACDNSQFLRVSTARLLIYPILRHCTDIHVVRDFMFLDIALDSLQQNIIQELAQQENDPVCVSLYCRMEQLGHLLSSLMNLHPWYEEICAVHADWNAIALYHAELINQARQPHTHHAADVNINNAKRGGHPNPSAPQVGPSLVAPMLVATPVPKTSFNEPPKAMLASPPSEASGGAGNSVGAADDNPVESALCLKSVCDRIHRCVGKLMDLCEENFHDKATFLGQHVGADGSTTECFVEDMVRNSVLFSVSQVLQRVEPFLREIAHLPPWQLVSTVERVEGELVLVDRLTSVEDRIFEVPTILVCNAASGEEEIPEGLVGVLVRHGSEGPDLLSHLAVRARNLRILFATCFEKQITERLQIYNGQWVRVTVKRDGSDLFIKACPRVENPELTPEGTPPELTRPTGDASAATSSDAALGRHQPHHAPPPTGEPLNLSMAPASGAPWVVLARDFDAHNVGQKCLNLQRMASVGVNSVQIPQSLALPFGTFERTLLYHKNEGILESLTRVLKDLSHSSQLASPPPAPTGPPTLAPGLSTADVGATGNVATPPTARDSPLNRQLEEARQLVMRLVAPPELMQEFRQAVQDTSCKRLGALFMSSESRAWECIKKVWASMFSLRPWLAIHRARLSYADLSLAILAQEVVPPDYAFIIHTCNPFPQQDASNDELYAEIVVGLGEALTANLSFPGRALSFRVNKSAGAEPQCLSFPSKSVGLLGRPSIIFRADPNAQKLEGVIGQGMFGSYVTDEAKRVRLEYRGVRLVNDKQWRVQLMKNIAKIGLDIEEAMGGPQDIEGLIKSNQIIIVQTRPQAGVSR